LLFLEKFFLVHLFWFCFGLFEETTQVRKNMEIIIDVLHILRNLHVFLFGIFLNHLETFDNRERELVIWRYFSSNLNAKNS
jgi:hypothetical protein